MEEKDINTHVVAVTAIIKDELPDYTWKRIEALIKHENIDPSSS